MDNSCILQYFEWNTPNDGEHWNRLAAFAPRLQELGVGAVWIPPCCKAAGMNGAGYDIYDLYDLGEFDQKGSVRTKYGLREQLRAAVDALHAQGIQVYADVVLNHKAGADATETFAVVEVDWNDRLHELSPPFDIEGWTLFRFDGRGGKYSAFQWDHTHFTATDRDERTGRTALFKMVGPGKDWESKVDTEKKNYDYLMCADIDHNNEIVVEELFRWTDWYIDTLALDGFRLDAIKHIGQDFIRGLIDRARQKAGENFFVVGEYWLPNKETLTHYIDESHQALQLFDVALHNHFYEASHGGRDYDLSGILADTLVSTNPFRAVTFVDNHDSQPGQALQSWVEDWFKPLAYALILLRRDGLPCVFLGDYEGISGDQPIAGKSELLDKLLYARRALAYGEQHDAFDHHNVVGWARSGDDEHPNSGLAVVMSNGDDGEKKLCLGSRAAGWQLRDLLGNRTETITLDGDGCAVFPVNGGSISVWARG